ncbi:MAG: hypothetical protein GXY13_05740 [Acidimicrobiales bacterium]|nr:hypothetical protein [Acidimicrobiales bacterium]
MGNDESFPRPRPTPAMVRRHFGLPDRPAASEPHRRDDEYRVGVGPGGGLEHHIGALSRLVRQIEGEELAHEVVVSLDRDALVDVIVRAHWAMGCWVQIRDHADVLDERVVDELHLLGFTTRPVADPPIEGHVVRHDWYEEPGHDRSALATRVVAVWAVRGVVAEDVLRYRVQPVVPEVTVEEWLLNLCDDDDLDRIVDDAG